MHTTARFCALMFMAAVIAGCGKSAPPPPPPVVAAAPVAPTPEAMPAMADKAKVEINLIDPKGIGAMIGSVELSDTAGGLMLMPALTGLPPGESGFHFHQNPDCGPAMKDGAMTAGEAAGEHYDPDGTGKHAGPGGPGHAGDLPRLVVTPDGKASTPLSVARLKVAELKNRALIIHAENDNYADAPGGARIACGVVR